MNDAGTNISSLVHEEFSNSPSLEEFFEAIHGELTELIEINLLARTGKTTYDSAVRQFLPRQTLLENFTAIQQVNQERFPQWEGEYGVTPIFSPAPRWRRGGKKTDVRLVPCLWADLDFYEFEPSEDDLVFNLSNVLRRIRSYSPQPTVSVFSGHGLHLYWRLEKPTTDIARCEAIMAEISRELDGDPVHNINHMMRLPNTTNWKIPEHPVPCYVLDIRK